MGTFKIRPLNEISEFVADILPIHLWDTSEKLEREVERLFNRFDPELLIANLAKSNQPMFFDIALLDLKMIVAALSHQREDKPIAIPLVLGNAVTTLCKICDQPEVLTYEELIFVNPSSDTRVFSSTEMASSERLFYDVHLAIEQRLTVVLQKVRNVFESPKDSNALEEFDTIRNDLAYAKQMMKMLHETLNTGHFEKFRKYFNGYPEKNLKGPSGAFSGAIPEIHFRYGYDESDAEYVEYIKNNIQLFPRANRAILQNFIEGKQMSLITLANQEGNEELKSRLPVLAEFLQQFRGDHYGLVKKHLPGAANDQIPGSSGEKNPGQFLRNRMKNSFKKG